MTLSVSDLLLYAVALFILFLTPGPVWLAILARTVANGFNGAWPLALGVAVGDIVWPLLAILGLAWITSEYQGALALLRWVACGFFLWLGWTVIRNAGHEIRTDGRLTRPGMLAGFIAGIVVILGNPKAILFYMGVLPGFFDLSAVTATDVVVICALSFAVPLIGNLGFAWSVNHIRTLVTSPRAMRRMNQVAGGLLIFVGLIVPFT